ncbi:DNA-directed RNA polymerases I and III subunit RPAC1-like isoform X2 [Oscarella lobularis]|uniref:DNA-directed RNA polymerases I and III subunit RPAC1-like isoform X2 n=1 Tax=Oscarella lobularis TaxID=121494 RepID=UPI003313ED98
MESSDERMERMRSRVEMTRYAVDSPSSKTFPRTYSNYDDSWSLEKFREKFRIDIVSLTDTDIEFDMIGIDASVANAFRRILLAEIPTMAIEKVFLLNNTSIVQDEVLAHRLGLIPILADPREFEFRTNIDDETTYSGTESDTIEFHLKVKCLRNPRAPKGSTHPNDLYLHSNVMSSDLKWVPLGNQLEKFGPNGIRPVHNDILIAKLRPGQEIDLRVHCVKGIGQDHAKFSPVGTASYRLLPEIVITRPITGESADRFARCFPDGVIAVDNVGGVKTARVANPRLDTCSREVLRYEDLAECVKLLRTFSLPRR